MHATVVQFSSAVKILPTLEPNKHKLCKNKVFQQQQKNLSTEGHLKYRSSGFFCTLDILNHVWDIWWFLIAMYRVCIIILQALVSWTWGSECWPLLCGFSASIHWFSTCLLKKIWNLWKLDIGTKTQQHPVHDPAWSILLSILVLMQMAKMRPQYSTAVLNNFFHSREESIHGGVIWEAVRNTQGSFLRICSCLCCCRPWHLTLYNSLLFPWHTFTTAAFGLGILESSADKVQRKKVFGIQCFWLEKQWQKCRALPAFCQRILMYWKFQVPTYQNTERGFKGLGSGGCPSCDAGDVPTGSNNHKQGEKMVLLFRISNMLWKKSGFYLHIPWKGSTRVSDSAVSF